MQQNTTMKNFSQGNIHTPIGKYSWKSRMLAAIIVAYVAYLTFHVLDDFIEKRFGRKKEINEIRALADTYYARALSLFAATSIFVVSLIAIVQILGFGSLLEVGGVIGFMGVMPNAYTRCLGT